ncbi:MAG: hypothetical protein CL466_08365 [Acidimicrobiaceae bacterium]|nr:hypothetical protein [Acidimicrobiaceae bacterium]
MDWADFIEGEPGGLFKEDSADPSPEELTGGLGQLIDGHGDDRRVRHRRVADRSLYPTGPNGMSSGRFERRGGTRAAAYDLMIDA